MNNYAPLVPRDKGGSLKCGYAPSKVANVTTNKENATASSILLLNANTTEIEVAAAGQNVAGKWLTQAVIDSSVAGTSVLTAAGSANFDFMVGTNTVRRFVVPQVVKSHVASIAAVRDVYGLAPAVAFKTFAGAGSVLTVEHK